VQGSHGARQLDSSSSVGLERFIWMLWHIPRRQRIASTSKKGQGSMTGLGVAGYMQHCIVCVRVGSLMTCSGVRSRPDTSCEERICIHVHVSTSGQ